MKSKRAFAAKVKKVILKVAEPKQLGGTPGIIQAYHNTPTIHHLNASARMPILGSGDTERIGDQINMIGWKVKFLLTQKSDRPNVNWRIAFVKVPKGSSYVYNQWFNNYANNTMMDEFNSDFVKVIKDVNFKRIVSDQDAGAVAREYTFVSKYYIPDKRKYKFGPTSGAQTHNQDDIYMVLATYDAAGTLITDNIGAYQMWYECMYRDP